MSDRLERFLSDLVEFGLITVDERQALIVGEQGRSGSGIDGTQVNGFVEELVRQGRVTAFQASLLVAGRGRELRLEKYLILEKLGEGGMGAVYKAVHELLRRTVAIKTIRSTVIDAKAIQRFQQEIEAVGRLNHPHVVRASHAGQANGIQYLVMEYVPGVDLAQVSRQCGPLPAAKACEIVRQTAVGLQSIHECGLVHRDIKPSNLMLTAEGTVRILDLGLARLQQAEPQERRLTAAGQILGTVDYIAPEQAVGDAEVDIRADIYSLGCTLFRLLTGHVAYPAPQYVGKMERLLAHVKEPFPDIRTERSDLSPSLVAVLHRMVEKLADARFQTPAEVESALRSFCSGADLGRLLVPERTGDLVGAAPTPASANEPVRRPQHVVIESASKRPRPSPIAAPPKGKAFQSVWPAALTSIVLLVVGLLIFIVPGDNDSWTNPIPTSVLERQRPESNATDAKPIAPAELPAESPVKVAAAPARDRTPAEQQRFDTAGEIASRVSRSTAANEGEYDEFFSVLAEIRNVPDVSQLLEQLLNGTPRDSGRRKYISQKLVEFVRTSQQQERTKVVLQACEAGLKFDPDAAGLFFVRGKVHRARGDVDRAIADWDEALRLDPANAAGFDDRGLAWSGKRNYDKAIADFDDSLRLDPNNVDVVNHRGIAWCGKGDHDRGIADFTEALRILPNSALLYGNRAEAWKQKREYDHAIADYDAALRFVPRSLSALNNRGNVWFEKGEYERAIADYDAALSINANSSTAFFNRGRAWHARREYDKAIADHTEVLRIDPKSAWGFGHRAKSFAASGEFAKAVADYEESLRLDPAGWIFRSYADFLSSCPNADFRHGQRALELARKAITLAGADADWENQAALAAAYAETGDFDQAVATQRKALEDTSLDDEDRVEMQSRLDLYQSRLPWRRP